MDMKKLLEAVTKFAGEPEQKPGDQVRGTDVAKKGGKDHPFKGQLVGDSKDNMLKGLSHVAEEKGLEWDLAEAYANFMEDDIGVEPKRPGRKSDRPRREYTKHGKPSKRYTTVEEGWNTGSDRVSLPDEPSTYWAGKGALQADYNRLYDELVPSQGKADTIEGEVLRASSKIVYRHYNDGDEFNQASFDQLEPYIGAVTSYDDLAHKAVEFAVKANGNYTPNPDWDSLDAMDYGPVDDSDDYDDEDDDYDDWSDDVDNEEEDDEVDEGVIDTVKGVVRGVKRGIEADNKGWKKFGQAWGAAQDGDAKSTRKFGRDAERYRNLGQGAKGKTAGGFPKSTKVDEEWQDGADLISQWNIPQQEWAQFEDAVESVIAATESDEAWEQFWKVINDDLQYLDRPVREAFERGLGSMDVSETTEYVLNGLRNGYESAGTEPRAALGLLTDIIEDGVRKLGVSEGWESGPEERSYRSRSSDPDDAYDAMRQEKADAEAQAAQAKRPQKKYFTLSGRGPNQEPNYEFPGEYSTQDEADKARARLMADPKTPNPRDIGIRSRTRYLDLKEGIESGDPVESAVLSAVQELIQQGHTEVAPEVITNMVVAATSQPFLLKDLVDANKNSPAIQHYVDSINPTKVKFSSDILTVKNENPAKEKQASQTGVANMAARAANRPRLGESSTPLRDKEDYQAKSKALQDIQMDPSTSQDPQLSAELARRKAELVQQAKQLGISESRAHKIIANKLKQIELQRKLGSPESDAAYAKHIDSVKKSSAEYVKNTPNTIYKREVDEEVAPVGNVATIAPVSTTTSTDPAAKLQAAKVSQATNAIKAATGASAPAPTITKALDAATQGKPVGATDMKALEPMMDVIGAAAQDPKLANQFKTLANQAKQVQQPIQK